jgi:DNA-binding CsgD family transcriptional regulator
MRHAREVDASLATTIDRGRAALATADWTAARSCFEQAAETTQAPDVLDGLGQALCWQGSYERGLSLRERAFARYLEIGDHRSCIAVALQVAALHWLVFGNGAAASGWMAQAQRCAEHVDDCAERGWLRLSEASATRDPMDSEQCARAALEIGRRLGDSALEFDALATVGRMLVDRGLLTEGMQLIDEALAAVSSGVVTDPWATAEIYCTLFGACELTLDVRRAREWLRAVDGYVARTGDLPTAGICRMHLGGVLTAAGLWADAERELLRSIGIYDDSFAGTRYEPVLRLADLRVRQGRLEEASELLTGYEEHPEATQPRARLHLALHEPEPAIHIARRHLHRRGRGLPSAPVLSLLVEADLACQEIDEARAVADELEQLAGEIRQPSLGGLAAWAQARVAVADGRRSARGHFEDALACFTEAGLPYELGRTRLELAALLAATDPSMSRIEARAAMSCLAELGAARDADAAAALCRELGDRSRPATRPPGLLTGRQAEVLQLLAAGLSNVEIAERLYISPRTAEHHVSGILAALGVSSRTQAAAYALRRPTEGTDRS